VASCLISPLSTAAKSSDEGGEVGSSVGILVACADAMARSRGTLGRPKKGMLSEKRLADGIKEDRLWFDAVDIITGAETDSSDEAADDNFRA
jgi:hypothetical protein